MKVIEPSKLDITKVEYTCDFCECRYAPANASELLHAEQGTEGGWKKPVVGAHCPMCGYLNALPKFVFVSKAKGAS